MKVNLNEVGQCSAHLLFCVETVQFTLSNTAADTWKRGAPLTRPPSPAHTVNRTDTHKQRGRKGAYGLHHIELLPVLHLLDLVHVVHRRLIEAQLLSVQVLICLRFKQDKNDEFSFGHVM